ncbi:MAG: DUF4843 domain-containing protein [Pseudobacter sp.]|uniref:DUF4843 domain-containing protein n=1 Tax=Pseudobacter sp. TaxID=2045420 RepID=UPI003F8226B0
MRILIIICTALTAYLLPGCKKREFLYQDISSRIWLGARLNTNNPNAYSDSAITTFMLKPAAAETDTLYLVANLTGKPAATDMPFVLEVVKDSTNVAPADYTMGATIMPANSYEARIPVIVKKNVPGLDLKKQRAKLVFRFVPNEHFLNGQPGRDMFRITWFDFLAKPGSWAAVESAIGPFSQARYRFIIDVLGVTEFTRYQGNFNLLLAVQAALRKALKDYNDDPANAGRPEGWPYLNDDGTPLTF